MQGLSIIQTIAIAALPVLFAITLHEAAHGFVALKLGDKTAYQLGRVTANPIKHISWLGTVAIPVMTLLLSGFLFGWAKPVPVNFNNLNKPKRDMALVAIAGPLANLIMAFIWAAIGKLGLMLTTHPSILSKLGLFLFGCGNIGIIINIWLMILNLLPLPPLDGSRVLASFLPPKLEAKYLKIEPYGFWILLALLISGLLFQIIAPPTQFLIHWIQSVFQLSVF